MRGSRILRRCYEEEQMGRPFIHGLKLYAFQAPAKRNNNAIQPLKPCMRDCNAIANTCAAKLFSFKEHLQQLFSVNVAKLKRKLLYHLFQHFPLFTSLKVRYYAVLIKNINKFHIKCQRVTESKYQRVIELKFLL